MWKCLQELLQLIPITNSRSSSPIQIHVFCKHPSHSPHNPVGQVVKNYPHFTKEVIGLWS